MQADRNDIASANAAAGDPPARAGQADAILLVLTTVASPEQAEQLAALLVDERLAACVNMLAGCTSVYRWQGARERAEETILLIKTTRERFPALEQRLRAVHPYELPEIVALSPEAVLPAYAAWVARETAGDPL
jgi:periplasmic divalent cation tolerance protein